jgi:hypothetical protein
MADAVSIKVKKTGRFKAPVLDHGQLTQVGTTMVEEQKRRWSQSVNADGGRAAPLSKPYLFRKAKIRKTNRPVRDLHLTGLLLSNFTLRKAINGVVRAEPTSRKGREHATSANRKDQMIGFSGQDVQAIYTETQKQYGALAKKLWFQAG